MAHRLMAGGLAAVAAGAAAGWGVLEKPRRPPPPAAVAAAHHANATAAATAASQPPQQTPASAASALAGALPTQHYAPLAPPAPGARLRQVQLVFRHGARTPLTDTAFLTDGAVWGAADCGPEYEDFAAAAAAATAAAAAAAGGSTAAAAAGSTPPAPTPAPPLDLVAAGGGPPAPSRHDAAQRAKVLPGGGCHKGELTRLGQRQALALGEWLRARYGAPGFGLLPSDEGYAPALVDAHTTKFSRTRETLRGVLAGAFPGLGRGGERPRAVSDGAIDELLFADSKHCPHLGLLMEASAARLAEAEARAHSDASGSGSGSSGGGLAALRAAVEAAYDNSVPAAFWARKWTWTDVHDALTSLTAHGKATPAALTAAQRREIDARATRQFAAYISPSLDDQHGHAMLRLSMGRLLDTIVANLRAMANHIDGSASTGSGNSSTSTSSNDAAAAPPPPPPVLHLYSGHDSTVMPLLLALGVEVARWPPYLSNVAIELWEMPPESSGGSGEGGASGGRFVVTALHNGKPVPLGRPSGNGGGSGSGDDGQAAEAAGAAEAPAALPAVALDEFAHNLVGAFVLSEADHSEACRVPLEHDTPLPERRREGGGGGGGDRSE